MSTLKDRLAEIASGVPMSASAKAWIITAIQKIGELEAENRTLRNYCVDQSMTQEMASTNRPPVNDREN